jgi:hypothetical protein
MNRHDLPCPSLHHVTLRSRDLYPSLDHVMYHVMALQNAERPTHLMCEMPVDAVVKARCAKFGRRGGRSVNENAEQEGAGGRE